MADFDDDVKSGKLPSERFYFKVTVKPVNKGHPREIQNVVFIEKWSLFGGCFVLFYQGRIIEMLSLFTEWYLFGGGL